MKKIYLQYALYNVWTNKQLILLIQQFSQEELEKELGGSFSSIQKTVYHLWMAEQIWLQRLQLAENISLPNENESFKSMIKNWQQTSKDLVKFVEELFNDDGIEHQVQYKSINKELFKTSVGDCLHQVFNHASFHRGQLINYCRMLGKTKIPATDYIAFVRRK
ncbi:MAG: DinB family protein [Chitinophagaceae bacterium]|nr:DinB family protein [Chitinophagaceae bacterium]